MEIRSEMQQGKLGDFIELAYGKGLPSVSRKRGSIPVYGSAGVIGTHNEFLVQGPGIVVGRAGTIGSVHWASENFYPIDTTYYVVVKREDIRIRYVYYLLKNLPLTAMNTGAAVPSLNRKNALRLNVSIPPVSLQDYISSVLSAYDDLIENNRRRIELLEKAARLIYEEWFIRLRFPGYENTKIIDGVPENWGWKKLGDIANITMGQSPKSIYYNEEKRGLPFHQGVTGFRTRFPMHRIYCTEQNRIAESGDILFSVRAPVGRINIAQDKIVIGRGLAAIRSKFGQQNFLLYSLKNKFFKEDMMGTGTIFAAVSKKDINGVELLSPPKDIVEKFIEKIEPMDSQISVLQKAIDKLAQARDLLLPRLV